MIGRRAVIFGASLLAIAAVGMGVEYVREIRAYPPSMLLACIDVDPPVTSWTCKQVLLRGSLSTEQVAELNTEGGAAYPLNLHDPKLAEEMLALFMERGVDINAGNERTEHWTALHQYVIQGAPDRVEILLRHGARVDQRDDHGNSALDVARSMQQRNAGDANRIAIVKMLEEAADSKPRVTHP